MSQPIKRDDRFQGAIKSQANIQTVKKQHRSLLNYREDNHYGYQSQTERATTFLGKKPHQFSEARTEAKVNIFINHSTKNRAPTHFERATGYTRTPKSRGEVQLGVLQKDKHLRVIELEPHARGIAYDPKETWTSKGKNLSLSNEPSLYYLVPIKISKLLK